MGVRRSKIKVTRNGRQIWRMHHSLPIWSNFFLIVILQKKTRQTVKGHDSLADTEQSVLKSSNGLIL